MPETNAVSGASSYEEYLAKARQPKQNLGKDEFLQLLVAQLSNQNPMEPMSDTDFIAQMAQFSSLEQMQALNTNFTMSQAFGMTGKTVYAEITMNGQTVPVFGVVDSVYVKDGTAYLNVGDVSIPSASVIAVYDMATLNGTNSPLLTVSGLIGRTVTALIPAEEDAEDKTPQKITGVVEKVFYNDDGVLMALVDGKEVAFANITEIAA